MSLKICLQVTAVATVTALVFLQLKREVHDLGLMACTRVSNWVKIARNLAIMLNWVVVFYSCILSFWNRELLPDYVVGLCGASGW